MSFWEVAGLATVGLLFLNALVVLLLFAGKRSEESTFNPRSDYSDFLAETEARVSRMHFRRTTRWVEEVR